MTDVLAIILGGGQGSRLFPLTHTRSKPAVPIGGKYRLIDIPISNCLHADLRSIYVLTQFNSASLNRHVSQTYQLDHFSRGFVEIVAAEQTPENANWFQGTADAVRRAMRNFAQADADYYLILAGDHLYRMDFREIIDEHIESNADITIAAQPVTIEDASSMGIFRFDRSGRIEAFEEKPNRARLDQIGSSVPEDSSVGARVPDDKPFVASMGIYVFSKDVLIEMLTESTTAVDFGREVIPSALSTHNVQAYFFNGYWADVGTIASFYDANIMLTEPNAPFNFYDPVRPIFTRARYLPPARFEDCSITRTIIAEGSHLSKVIVEDSVVGIRQRIREGSRIIRTVINGADYYEGEESRDRTQIPLGIGRNCVLDGVIVDKNARIGDEVHLCNAAQVQDADGPGYVIRDGIIIVRNGATVPSGTRV
jgi:glucose-1-phosphate adenylyltransferase